jgi:flagellar biogenesis protein FliO
MEVARQILSVLAVFLLLGLALWRFRRSSAAGAPAAGPAGWFRIAGGLGAGRMISRGRERCLERVDRLALTPQHTLHLVRVQGRELVVATHPQGCLLITRTAETKRDPAGPFSRNAAVSTGVAS